MKLNPDCIRDILISVEEDTDFTKDFEYEKGDSAHPLLNKYSHDELIYHIRQCELSDLILDVEFSEIDEYITISDLSPSGHEFLSNVRSDTVWNHTKSIALKLGSYSLDVLTKIAVGVLTQMINAQLQTH